MPPAANAAAAAASPSIPRPRPASAERRGERAVNVAASSDDRLRRRLRASRSRDETTRTTHYHAVRRRLLPRATARTLLVVLRPRHRDPRQDCSRSSPRGATPPHGSSRVTALGFAAAASATTSWLGPSRRLVAWRRSMLGDVENRRRHDGDLTARAGGIVRRDRPHQEARTTRLVIASLRRRRSPRRVGALSCRDFSNLWLCKVFLPTTCADGGALDEQEEQARRVNRAGQSQGEIYDESFRNATSTGGHPSIPSARSKMVASFVCAIALAAAAITHASERRRPARWSSTRKFRRRRTRCEERHPGLRSRRVRAAPHPRNEGKPRSRPIKIAAGDALRGRRQAKASREARRTS